MDVRNFLFDHGLWLHEHSFPVPVICVGNLSVGGTGKTPHTEYLVSLLLKSKRHTAVLSRGYGRRTKGYREVHKEASAEAVGDEPLQMARKHPTARFAVCERRCLGISRLLSEGQRPQVIVLDDAFQHRYVLPSLRILLTDYACRYSTDHVLPAGRLRESRNGARRANIVIVTKCPATLSRQEAEAIANELQIEARQQLFFTKMKYGKRYPLFDAGPRPVKIGKALAITGIAHPTPLYEQLQGEGFDVIPLAFPDHHSFSPADLERMVRAYEAIGNEATVVTTEKDAARLRFQAERLPEYFRKNFWVQPIEIDFLFDEAPRFNKIIQSLC